LDVGLRLLIKRRRMNNRWRKRRNIFRVGGKWGRNKKIQELLRSHQAEKLKNLNKDK